MYSLTQITSRVSCALVEHMNSDSNKDLIWLRESLVLKSFCVTEIQFLFLIQINIKMPEWVSLTQDNQFYAWLVMILNDEICPVFLLDH